VSVIKLQWVQRVHSPKMGSIYYYFDRDGSPRARLPGLPGSAEFMQAYNQALGAKPIEVGGKRTLAGSVDSAVAAFLASAAFQALAPITQAQRRWSLEPFRIEAGKWPIKQLQRRHLVAYLDKIARPHQRRKFLIAIRAVLQHASSIGLIEDDPSIGLKAKVPRSDGHRQWDDAAIAVYRAHHKSGTAERLALEFLLSTALRRGDAVKAGRQHMVALSDPMSGATIDVVRIRTGKTGVTALAPILPELAAELVQVPLDRLTFLVGDRGGPLTPDAFTHWFRDACDGAGLAGYSAHGLRKAALRRLAERGGTAHELGALGTHASIANVAHYTREASKVGLLFSAVDKIRSRTAAAKTQPEPLKRPAKMLTR
jgi:integrase